MALTNTSYRYQYGVALSEAGLNKISKALRRVKPDLFAKRTDIPIKAASGTEAAHVLALYAMVNTDSLVFDIYPLAGEPSAPLDSLSVLVNMEFSLTDNILGFITRLSVTIKASARVLRDGEKLRVSLLGFQVLKVEDRQPQFPVRLANGSLDAKDKIATVYRIKSATDPQLADSLTALVNYLIDLFLKDALTKAVVEFPIPDLSSIIKLGTLVFSQDEFRGPFLRNDALNAMLGADLSTPLVFPAAYPGVADVRTGISKSGMDRIARALLPMSLPDQDFNHNYNTFYLHAYNIRIESVDFYLTPGDNAIRTRLFFSGVFQLNIQFDVPLINKHVDIPIPIPLDKLSHYYGKISPNLVIDPLNDPNGQVHVHLMPHVKFLDDWYVFLLTDYRDFLADFLRRWVDQFKDFFIVKFLRHIPILGWILDKVIDMTSWVLGYLLGAYLDYVVSTWLNLLINILGRAAIAIWYRPDFDIYQLPQKKLKDMVGLVIRSGEVAVVDDGRDGELEIRLLFEQGSLPTPTNVVVDPVRPPHVPVTTLPPVEGIGHLPVYVATDFQPARTWPNPTFSVLTQRLRATITVGGPSPQTLNGSVNISYSKDGDQWTIQKSVSVAGTGTETTALTYDASFRPLHLDSSVGTASGLSFHFTAAVDSVSQVLAFTEDQSLPRSIAFFPRITFELLDFWIYRLSYTDLSSLPTGKVSRFSLQSKF